MECLKLGPSYSKNHKTVNFPIKFFFLTLDIEKLFSILDLLNKLYYWIGLIVKLVSKLDFGENTTKMKWMIILRQKTKTFQFNQNVTLKRQEVFTFSEWEKG